MLTTTSVFPKGKLLMTIYVLFHVCAKVQ